MKCNISDFMPIFKRRFYKYGENTVAITIPFDLTNLLKIRAGDMGGMDVGIDAEGNKYIVIKPIKETKII